MKKKCGFDTGQCNNNCSECAGANFIFKVLEASQRKREERDKQYKKALSSNRD